MSEVTRILNAIEKGDTRASGELLTLLYDELRRLAADKMSHEKPGQTLQATALVHEAYLRLVDGGQQWNSRGHFFAAAAEAMRRILIEHARRRNSATRGGTVGREELSEFQIVIAEPEEDVLALNDALVQLTIVDPAAANLVRLRFFAGLNMSEAALALDMSVRSAQNLWAYARAWLHRKLRPE